MRGSMCVCQLVWIYLLSGRHRPKGAHINDVKLYFILRICLIVYERVCQGILINCSQESKGERAGGIRVN